MDWKIRNKAIFILLFTCFTVSGLTGEVNSQDLIGLETVIEWGLENAPAIEELYEEKRDIENSIKEIKTVYNWQSGISGSIDEEPGVKVEIDARRNFPYGFSFSAETGFWEEGIDRRRRIEDFDNINDKFQYNFKFGTDYQIYPLNPTSTERSLISEQEKLENSKNKIEYKINGIILDWIEDYFDLYLSQTELKISREELQLAQQRKESVKKQKEIGEIDEISFLEQKINLQRAERNFERQELSFDNTRENFKEKLNLPEAKKIKIENPYLYIEDLLSGSNIKELLTDENRNELLEMMYSFDPTLQSNLSNQELTTQRKQWFKEDSGFTVDFSGRVDYPDPELSGVVSFSYDFTDGGQTELEIQNYQDNLESLKEREQEIKEGIEEKLDSKLKEIEFIKREMEEKQLEEKKGKLELEKSESKYEEGIIEKGEYKEKQFDVKRNSLDLMEVEVELMFEKLQLAQMAGI